MLSAFVIISLIIYIVEVFVKKRVIVSANETNSAESQDSAPRYSNGQELASKFVSKITNNIVD